MEYCDKCGSKLIKKECENCGIIEGIVPYCPDCNEFHFPYFNVAVSSVIYNNDFSKILLIKQYKRDWNILVAGYVSKKETLEHALKREIKEETGLEIVSFKYNQSQYYEKSNSLICNFISKAKDENFKLNAEVDFAKWYTIKEAKEAVLKGSLAETFLILSLSKIPF